MLVRYIAFLWLLLAVPIMAAEGHYRIDTNNSHIRVLTDKSGLFGGMGHHHVVNINNLAGEVQISAQKAGHVSLVLKPEDFLLDDAADIARYPEHFKKPVPEKSIKATRKNMLGKKLFEVTRFPEILVQISVADVLAKEAVFDLSLQVKDQTVELRVPGVLEIADGQLRAQAVFVSSNPALGLPVFRALAGAMAVGKKLEFEVDVRAGLIGPEVVNSREGDKNKGF